ncbi:hypothetical protein NW762_013949 [Fusarium torreyae]|uniref:Zn(2)-C6 fungal-type domain-containing protein n=1 Tax=Fusarium torreyae TaxID=1237075 RepID=A0A9W8V749_9HYPO|nr:hypothetical protein NW762_013949 [Fusarium torreyae]
MEHGAITINACNRCRKRKARCDTQIPACRPCQNSGSICEFTDGRSGNVHPRSLIHDLESELLRLERMLEENSDPLVEAPPETPTLLSDEEAPQEFIHEGVDGHAHFIGASSGMYLVRSVLESAQQNYSDFYPPPESDDLVRATPKEPARTDTRIALPSLETAKSLIDTFFSQYQVQYPILDQNEFTKTISEFYDRQNNGTGSSHSVPGDVWTRFMLNMTLAISLAFVSGDHDKGLAISKGFATNALAELDLIMQTKNVQSVQCLLLLLLLSILDSSFAPIWYISGLCMRMCIDLGYHSEATIALSSSFDKDGDDIVRVADTKRRLFWLTYSFDRTLSILLGRPFTFNDFTANTRLPGDSLQPSKRQQILHWLELQRLQSKIVEKLHTARQDIIRPPEEGTDLSQWTTQMAQSLEAWNRKAQTLVDSDGHNTNWWGYWYRTALLILYRPSPSRPDMDASDTLSCYLVAKDLIQLSFLRINDGLMEFTWIDLHFQLMSGITLIFIVRKKTAAWEKSKEDWISFKSCLFQWKLILEKLGSRWRRIARAREALLKLADATLDLIEKDQIRSMGGYQQQHHKKEMRRDLRRSILQQLQAGDFDSLTQRSPVQTRDDAGLPGSSVPPVNGYSDGGETSQVYDSMMNTEDRHQTVANTHWDSSQGWATLDSADGLQRQLLPEEAQVPDDISTMITEQIWPLFDLSGAVTEPDELDFWRQFSAPILGADGMATVQFNSTNRPDESFTNSILNFHGDLSNLTPEMQVEYAGEGEYMQGLDSS